jgi:hypothetical protein
MEQDEYPAISGSTGLAAVHGSDAHGLRADRKLSQERGLRAHQSDSPGSGFRSSNIAEGGGRMTDKSFAVFLAQARGSLFELQTQIELARDLGFAAQGPTQS